MVQHKHNKRILCERCQELSNGRMIPAVQDFSSRQMSDAQLAGKALISPDQLRAQLKGLSEQRILAVLMVDLLDCSGSFLTRVRDLIGRNPVFLVGTKVDLLPKGSDVPAVRDWLLAIAGHRRLNVVNAHLVGSPTGQGVSEVASALLRERKGRDVYVLGAANVGKSSFIRALVKEMSKGTSQCFQPPSKSQSRRLPVESAMPGTTLQTIQLQAFTSGGCLFDTPGIHLHHRLPHLLTPEELKQMHPRRRLRPYYPPAPEDLAQEEDEGAAGSSSMTNESVSATYQWGGVARLDVVSAPPGTALVFYGPPALHVHAMPLLSQHDMVQSASTLAAQHSSSLHDAAQRDSAQRDSAGLEAAQHGSAQRDSAQQDSAQSNAAERDSAQAEAAEADQSHSQHLSSSPVSNNFHTTANAQSTRLRTQQDLSRTSDAADSEADEGLAPAQHLSDIQSPKQARQLLQAEPHGTVSHQHAAAGEEEEEGDEGLFAEASVQARGGLKLTEKVIQVSKLSGAVADIAISGLPGWVTVLSPGTKGLVCLRVWAPVGVEVFVRPPMPVPCSVQHHSAQTHAIW
ncbi:hypothetical protein ABBQ38_012336 [Trebouxia sp. C0009 RCD-2024]